MSEVQRLRERLTRLAAHWRSCAVRPPVIDTEGRMVLSTMAMVYDSCAQSIEEIVALEREIEAFRVGQNR